MMCRQPPANDGCIDDGILNDWRTSASPAAISGRGAVAYLSYRWFGADTSMARRAASSSKTRTARKQIAPDIVTGQSPAIPSRRGRKPKGYDVPSADLSCSDAFFPGGDEPTPEAAKPEMEPPAKTRRGRPPKAQPAPEQAGTSDNTAPAMGKTAEHADVPNGSEPFNPTAENVAEPATETPPVAKARRGRPPRTKPVQPSSATPAVQPTHAAAMVAPDGDQHGAKAATSGPSAARWDPSTGTATFDWPTIEQVAATEGPNQAMARLLLAARAEGANSRWPF